MIATTDKKRHVSRERSTELISAAAYGTVLVLISLSVITASEISAGFGAELIAGVGLATWVAHLYAELLAGHVRRQRPLQRPEVVRALADGSPILASTALPAATLFLGHLDVVDVGVARTMAIVCGVIQLLAIGLVVGRLAPGRHAATWIYGGVTVGTGLVVATVASRLGH